MRPLPLLFKRQLLAMLLASWTAVGPVVGAYASDAAPAVAAAADADLAKVRTADPELADGLAVLRRDVDKLLPR